jgi:DNA primase
MQFNKELKAWLYSHKITDQVIEDFNIHGESHIVIPVDDIYGDFVFNKYRRNPAIDTGMKYWYDKGGKVTLYGGFKAFSDGHDKILITEGEKDCLVAWSHNIPAVTSTGGALSFQEEWAEYFKNKEVIICMDNDSAGADGAVKILDILPKAKVLFLPDSPDINDISDYVMNGGDLHTLIKTAQHFESIEDVKDDRLTRLALRQSVYFHNAYIKKHTKVAPKNVARQTYSSDAVTRAKEYPVENLLEFKSKKAICPFHLEKTGSLYHNVDTNTTFCFGACHKPYDSISIYMQQNDCTFSEAVKELNKL